MTEQDDEEDDTGDDGTFSIRIVDNDGDPISDRRVSVSYGLLGVQTEHTDSDGWCEFPTLGRSSIDGIYSYELYGLLVSEREITLSDYEEIYDGATFSFTIDDE